MRTLPGPAILVSLLAVCAAPIACGGGAPPAGATTPPTAASDAPVDPAASAGPTTTTTAGLASAGDAQGSKLDTTAPPAASGSAAPAGKGPHTHDPGRSRDDIRAIVIAHRDEARACYDAALKDHPGIEGDLVIQWTIDPKGVVSTVSQDTARSQITEPSVVGCIVKIIQGIQFAASAGGYETKAFYPFNFHPHHGQPSGGSSPPPAH